MPRQRPATGDEPDVPVPERAWRLINETIRSFVANQNTDSLSILRAAAPADQLANLQKVLDAYQGAGRSYRIALIIQFAYALVATPHFDLTQRPSGARGREGVGGKVGTLLRELHIVSVADAYQNIGKNTPELARGNMLEFDAVLRWASG